MDGWWRQRLSRRGLIWGGLAAAGGTAVYASGALGQANHATHGAPVAGPQAVPAHRAAHGAMITVGDVDYARNGFDPTALLTDWDIGDRVAAAGRTHAADLRGHRRGQGDRDRAGGDVPGLDLQRPRSRAQPAGHGGRAPADRLQELRVAPPLDALPRHPRGAHGRHPGSRRDRPGRGVRLRVRCPPLRLPSLPLPRAAAEAAHPQRHVRRLRHRSRSGASSRPRPRSPDRGCSERPRTPSGRNS